MSDKLWVATRVFDTTDTGAPTNGGGLGEHLLIAYGQEQVLDRTNQNIDPDGNDQQQDAQGVASIGAVTSEDAERNAAQEVEETTESSSVHETEEVTTELSDLASEVFGTVPALDALIEHTDGAYKLPVKEAKKPAAKKATATRKKKPASSQSNRR